LVVVLKMTVPIVGLTMAFRWVTDILGSKKPCVVDDTSTSPSFLTVSLVPVAFPTFNAEEVAVVPDPTTCNMLEGTLVPIPTWLNTIEGISIMSWGIIITFDKRAFFEEIMGY
jgi:hypothetical protein